MKNVKIVITSLCVCFTTTTAFAKDRQQKAINIATALITRYETFIPIKMLDGSGKFDIIGYGDKECAKKYDKITQQQADKCLNDRLLIDYKNLSKNAFFTKLKPHQQSAVLSLVYNIGFSRFNNSRLFTALKKNDKIGIAIEWKDMVLSSNKKLNGLVKRRNEELEVFFK